MGQPEPLHLNRFELADLHHPIVLARKVHDLLGTVDSAVLVDEIARALDIVDVRLDRFDGFEGMLLTDRVRSTGAILANTSKGYRRARFTVAHELGHFLMERHELTSDGGFKCRAQDLRETREGRQHVRQESQANQFAAELLAPTDLVAPLLSPEPDLRDAQRMRDHLDLSLEVCIRRMIGSRDEVLAAAWSFKGEIRCTVEGGEFPYVTVSRGDRLPPISAAYRAVQNAQPGFTEFAEAHPLSWTSRTDLNLYEQTRVSNNGHAVTLLWADIPDPDDDDDDPGRPELSVPTFR